MDPVTRKPWLWQVTGLSILLGMFGVLIVTAIASQKQVEISGIPSGGFTGLLAAYQEQKATNVTYQNEIRDLRQKVIDAESQMSDESGAQATIHKELNETRFLAGLTPVQGPGVVVTMRDSDKAPPDAPTAIVEQYMIHDYDISKVVNELKASGAEAISINDQRVIATTAVRCVGPVMQVNGAGVGMLGGGPTGSKYVIKATGSPEVLESGLRLPLGVLSEFLQTDDKMMKIERKPKILIPAFSGSTHFTYTEPTGRQQ